jgi:hypothetical protein
MKRYVSLLLVISSLAATPAIAGSLGIGTIEGTWKGDGVAIPVKGLIALVDATSNDVRPLASLPDPQTCDGEPMLKRETTLEWQRKSHAALAFNGGFWWMPEKQPIPACQFPAEPYKSGDYLRFSQGTVGAAMVLALGRGVEPRIGRADSLDLAHYDVAVSGDWVRSRDGQVVHRPLLLDHGQPSSGKERAARTAIGVNGANGHLIVAMFEGTRDEGGGLSLGALAELLRACGATDAINLDGGGSATFSYVPPIGQTQETPIRRLSLEAICNRDALAENGFDVRVEPQPLDRPLRSQAAGSVGALETGLDKGYRPVLINLGFQIGTAGREEGCHADCNFLGSGK